MKFDNVASAYGFYRNMDLKTMESRAQAIRADIAGNAEADIQAYQFELEGIENAMKEKRSEAKPKEQKVVLTATETADDAAGSKMYRSAFYKKLLGGKLTPEETRAFEAVNEKRSAEFNTLSNSAAVIPEQTLDQVLVKARDQGGIMSIARAFNVPSGLSLPVATPGDPASWHVEGAEVEREKVSPTRVKFSAFEIMKVLSMSAAARTMSIDAFESYISDELAASVMAALAKSMVDGTGEGQATGIISGITWDSTNQIEVAANAWLEDWHVLLNAVAKLHRGYARGARWVVNNSTLYSALYGLADDNNNPILMKDLADGGSYRLLGFPVVVDDFMADNDILFGNFSYYGYNLPSGLALDVSTESGFTRGLIDYRALAICDAKPIVDEAFVRVVKGE